MVGNPLGWVLHISSMIPGVGVIRVLISADAALLDRPEELNRVPSLRLHLHPI